MSRSLKKVLIMAGGTGGHIFPGLAVAKCLQDKGIEVHWLGTEKGLEAKLVAEVNLPLHYIPIGGVRGKNIKTLLLSPFRVGRAIYKARQILKNVEPDVVIGMGGFASGPGGVASWLLNIPLVIHEQNAKPGMTNKVLAYLAYKVLEGFPATFKSTKALAIGNPVRVEIENLLTPELRFQQKKPPLRLLILGGSLGAQALNELIPRALNFLTAEDRPMIYHQTGEKHFEATKQAYKSLGICANIQPFIKEIDAAYAWADIVICRAGALTVSELCSAGLGAIFVPFPYAVDDHQTANAHYMVKNNAALCIPQAHLSASSLANLIQQYANAPDKCLSMAKAAYSLRKPRVAEKIFDILTEIVTLKLI